MVRMNRAMMKVAMTKGLVQNMADGANAVEEHVDGLRCDEEV